MSSRQISLCQFYVSFLMPVSLKSDFLDKEQFHRLCKSGNVNDETAAVFIALLTVKMLRRFICLRRSQQHRIPLFFHIVFPIFHQLSAAAFSLVFFIYEKHIAKRCVIPKQAVSEQACRRAVKQYDISSSGPDFFFKFSLR